MYVSAILAALLASLIYGLLGICFQIAGQRRLKILDFMFYKQLIGFFLGLLISLYMGAPLYQPWLLLLGSIGALSYIITLGAYLKATREREIAASWTVLNLSVALPIAFSVFWFGDPFTWTKAFGVILTLFSIIFISGGFKSESWKSVNVTWFKWIIVAFFFNGWLVVLFRFVKSDEGPLFTTYFYGLSFLYLAIPPLWNRQMAKANKTTLWVSAGGAATHWTGIVLTIFALNLIAPVTDSPGVIIYPITNGLVIPIGVLLGMVLLKERTNRSTATGVALGMTALILFFL
jgi:drug/metabolite transporter (DMT)-like permease